VAPILSNITTYYGSLIFAQKKKKKNAPKLLSIDAWKKLMPN
jgi:hypothetical protein